MRAKRQSRQSSGGGKHVLQPPFGEDWTAAAADQAKLILKAMKLHLAFVADVRDRRRRDRQKKSENNGKKDKDNTGDNDMTLTRVGVLVGINQVTRALEKTRVAVVVLCQDIRPAAIASHVHVLCARRGVPLLVLPDNASVKLGQLLGTRVASAIALRALDVSGGEEGKLEEHDAKRVAEFRDNVRKLARVLQSHAAVPKQPWMPHSDQNTISYTTASVSLMKRNPQRAAADNNNNNNNNNNNISNQKNKRKSASASSSGDSAAAKRRRLMAMMMSKT
eukprot:TRINITY_DN67774_c11_g11_i1.p1 TRINITY_DN67774_c11_g11~~TRINITY_DN67774_c11_g11_i1.p1  ORF type:complete len:278 (+),score=99.57 TRINITY_DN67774_c11_g11_i1:12-845(+)